MPKFYDTRHKQDFLDVLRMMKSQDCYHQAVAYLLTLDVAIRAHINDVFDFADDCVKVNTALSHGWQTGTSRKSTRLRMNLWNGHCSDYDEVSANYAVDEIFCCGYAPYYWEAIKLRYPEYCQ